MVRTNIFLEERQYQEVMDLARRGKQTFSDVVREMIDEGVRARKRRQWSAAAELMVEDYANDKRLNALTGLDGEDFLE